jgi:hypothetical protein
MCISIDSYINNLTMSTVRVQKKKLREQFREEDRKSKELLAMVKLQAQLARARINQNSQMKREQLYNMCFGDLFASKNTPKKSTVTVEEVKNN